MEWINTVFPGNRNGIIISWLYGSNFFRMKGRFKFQSSELPCWYLITGKAILCILEPREWQLPVGHEPCHLHDSTAFLTFPSSRFRLRWIVPKDLCWALLPQKSNSRLSKKRYIGIVTSQGVLELWKSTNNMDSLWNVIKKDFVLSGCKPCVLIIWVFLQRKK